MTADRDDTAGTTDTAAAEAGSTRVALGGTFDPVHDGHRALFRRAFELGDVTVGLTSDDLAPETRNRERYVRTFAERKRDLERVLADLAGEHGREFEVRTLTEPTGIATEPEFDALVVSPETRDAGERINDLRRERGHDPLHVEVVDHVPAEDGEPISSTRIVNGEIDEHGNLTPDREGRESQRKYEARDASERRGQGRDVGTSGE